MRNQTFIFNNKPEIISAASVVGKEEGQGPMGHWFDYVSDDDTFGEKTWEKSESKMLKMAAEQAINKAGLNQEDIDVMLSGDLLNQIMSSSFMARDMGLPFIGLYGACSTMTESLMMASVLVDGGYCNTAVNCASSHFCSAERQFRMPLEHGNQKPPCAPSTVIGAGAMVVSGKGKGRNGKKAASGGKNVSNLSPAKGGKPDTVQAVRGVEKSSSKAIVRISSATVGKIIDVGVKDSNEMGAAMAPAAVDTILAHFRDTGRSFDDYDMVITGDLGYTGKAIAADILKQAGIPEEQLDTKLEDCGTLIYDKSMGFEGGGSGCGCSASVFAGYIYKRLQERSLKSVLVLSTGALLSTISPFQGESIPGIAHAVALEAEGDE